MRIDLEKTESADPPLPLFPPLPDGVTYPLTALGPLGRPARALADVTQCAPAIAAHAVLAACSLAAQSKADVLLPFGQSRPLSLFLFTIAASGERKTTVDNEACAPVHRYEERLREDFRAASDQHRARGLAWESQRKRIETNRVMDFAGQAAELERLGPMPEKPMAPFLTTGDLTIEGLARIWANARPSLGVLTAEGGTFTGGHGMSEDNKLRTAAALSGALGRQPVKRLRASEGGRSSRGGGRPCMCRSNRRPGRRFSPTGCCAIRAFSRACSWPRRNPGPATVCSRSRSRAISKELHAYTERVRAIFDFSRQRRRLRAELRLGLLK